MKPTTAQAITIAKVLGVIAAQGVAVEHEAKPIERLDKWGFFKQRGVTVTITLTLDHNGANLESDD